MTSGRTCVTVVPVAVQQEGHEGRPTFAGLAGADGEWATSPLHGRAGSTAERLLSAVLPPAATFLDRQTLHLRPVTFSEDPDTGSVTLLYTVALPMALTAAEDAASRWRPLVIPAPSADDARSAGDSAVAQVKYAEDLLEHWREVLEDTAGALLFLARYWTMPQLRVVYSAVWGYEQDAASFNRWADPRRGGALEGVAEFLDEDPPTVTEEIAQVFAAASSPTSSIPMLMSSGFTLGAFASGRDVQALAGWKAVATALRPKKRVGLALTQHDEPGAPVSTIAMVAAAARVAYQSSTRGPAPDWYTASIGDPHEHRLDKLYLPRPGWMRRRTPPVEGSSR